MRLRIGGLLVCLVAIAGCGARQEATPVACLDGAGAYEKALAAAPGRVLVGGETPISKCLTENQDAGDLAQVGETMVKVATGLNSEARRQPGGGAPVQLGYLLGAAERGAAATEGIHSDLVRRLTVAARYAPGHQPLTQEFLSGYREGFEAGRSGG